MRFNFYFTGVPAYSEQADYIINNNCCILLSQLNERGNIYKWIERLKENPQSTCKLFIDSGAFSAWTKGKEIDVDEYIEFINKYKEHLEICASVDKIPGQPRTSQVASQEDVDKAAAQTWDNFLYMRSKMDDVNKLLYTFHVGEPWERLKTALEYKDERGPINYIAFGGLVGKNSDVIKSFLDQAFKIIKRSSNPNIKVHAFGMTRLNLLEKYPFYSADSTSWLQTANFGSIIVGLKPLCISSRKNLSDDNFEYKSLSYKQEVAKIVEKRGFTIKELAEDSNKRLMFNIIEYQNWADSYTLKEDTFEKPSLF